MKSIAPILVVLFGVIGCDSEKPPELPQERAQTLSVSQLKEIADLESRLESEAKTNADTETEFKQRKAELEAKIAETVQKRDQLRKLQADHYTELAKEEAQEVERLKSTIKEIETWDPIQLGSISKMRELIEELAIENQNLKEQLDGARKQKP